MGLLDKPRKPPGLPSTIEMIRITVKKYPGLHHGQIVNIIKKTFWPEFTAPSYDRTFNCMDSRGHIIKDEYDRYYYSEIPTKVEQHPVDLPTKGDMIRAILRDAPKGMTPTEISNEVRKRYWNEDESIMRIRPAVYRMIYRGHVRKVNGKIYMGNETYMTPKSTPDYLPTKKEMILTVLSRTPGLSHKGIFSEVEKTYNWRDKPLLMRAATYNLLYLGYIVKINKRFYVEENAPRTTPRSPKAKGFLARSGLRSIPHIR